ncbi:MAG: hypothetical protein L0Z51_07830 [Candidatus Latescibacteria bacterium]|nr:hypothetical protein [Candidatus Latescibacterota bacterium]
MNKQSIRIILLSALMAALTVGVTGAKEQKMPKGKGVPGKPVPFSVTGVYSGSLSGEIVVNGQSVFVNEKTSIQVVGKGPGEFGESVSNAGVIVSGVMKGKKAIATMVVVGERESSKDFSQTTIEGAEVDPASKRAR